MTKNSSNSSGGGNTNSPPGKQISPSKYWCFTFNNYGENDLDQIVQTFESMNCKYIVGKEIGEENGTPHLQGYVESPKKIRGTGFKLSKKIHWEKRKGTRLNNLVYCSKEKEYKTNMIVPRPLQKIEKTDLREEQIEIANLFTKPEEKFGRKIYWYWESVGAWGKTILATYMVDQMGAIVIQGKASDAAYAVQQYLKENGQGPEIVIMDIPRTKGSEYISYQSIEQIKNGIFFSTKYEGGMVRFNRPHVIVFANEPPLTEKMSKDRWVIKEL